MNGAKYSSVSSKGNIWVCPQINLCDSTVPKEHAIKHWFSEDLMNVIMSNTYGVWAL